MSDLVGNTEVRFSRIAAQLYRQRVPQDDTYTANIVPSSCAGRYTSPSLNDRLWYTAGAITLYVIAYQILKHTLRKLVHADLFSEAKIEKFHWKKFDIFNILAQNFDCGYTLEPPRREIRKIGVPLHIPVLLQWGIRVTDIFPADTQENQ